VTVIYIITVLATVSFSLVHASDFTPCPNSCSSNGLCSRPWGVCECFQGFTGADCSLRTCPLGAISWTDSATSNDDAHHAAECSNMGECDRVLGICKCADGFEGSACERFACPNNCSDKGRCLSAKTLARMQDPGIQRKTDGCTADDICQDVDCNDRDYGKCKETYVYETPWDADHWFGCLCDEGYTGYDCSIRLCAEGDDPLTGSQNNDVQLFECHADFGTFTLSFGGETTVPISVDASVSDVTNALNALPSLIGQDPKVSVSWTGGISQVCVADGNQIQITFLQNFGDQPLLIPDGTNLGQTSVADTPIITAQKVVTGDKESDPCSNHGTCDETTGVCTCLSNWLTSDGYGNAGIRGDCGYLSTGTTTTCPGEPACLGKGSCGGPPSYRCECEAGRSGPDCALIDCPVGTSWFSMPSADNTAHADAECSDMGKCNRNNGVCECHDGFTGGACEYLTCHNDCNGNGECVSMATLAEHNHVNGVLTPFTYGSDPNNPLTWDADHMFGCLCSEGWEGYDCSLKSCPKGDDPHTQHQRNELQQLSCTDSHDIGSIEFKFRDESTTVAVSSTAADLEAALNSLSTINGVSVTYSDPNIYVGAPGLEADSLRICRATGQLVDIEFLSPTGNVPEVQVSSSTVDGDLSISTTQDGTKEYITCSGRGLCDHAFGVCECFHGYASSNGQGKVGTFGDCGYKNPYEDYE
jgi:hypothetical protein